MQKAKISYFGFLWAMAPWVQKWNFGHHAPCQKSESNGTLVHLSVCWFSCANGKYIFPADLKCLLSVGLWQDLPQSVLTYTPRSWSLDIAMTAHVSRFDSLLFARSPGWNWDQTYPHLLPQFPVTAVPELMHEQYWQHGSTAPSASAEKKVTFHTS